MTQPVPFGPADSDPQLWDRIVLGGVEFPGIATVEIDRSNKKDEKKSKGKHGSENEYSGAENAKVKITIRFWTAEQYDTVVTECLKVVEPDPTKKRVDSVTIGHPIASARRVTSIMVDKVSGPTRRDKVWELSIDATEAKAPEAKGATGKYSGKGGGMPPKDASCDNLKRRYDELVADYRAAFAKSESLEEQAARSPRPDSIFGASAADAAISDLREQAYQKRAEAQSRKAEADGIYGQMQARGCVQSPPSGSPGTTQP